MGIEVDQSTPLSAFPGAGQTSGQRCFAGSSIEGERARGDCLGDAAAVAVATLDRRRELRDEAHVGRGGGACSA